MITYSKHLLAMIEKRGLLKAWIEEALEKPDSKRVIDATEHHFFKRISDYESRCLKVVFNPQTRTAVTAHFDRKRSKGECR